jgi:hypothetical protein
VSIGPDAVDAAARAVVDRNPPNGKLRSVQGVGAGAAGGPSYRDSLGAAMAARPDAILHRVCGPERPQLATGRRPPATANVRTRYPISNPLVLDLLIGDHEVFLAVPDRSGHPSLRAGIVVDDPDFVAALRDWFDETVWDPPGGYLAAPAHGEHNPLITIAGPASATS